MRSVFIGSCYVLAILTLLAGASYLQVALQTGLNFFSIVAFVTALVGVVFWAGLGAFATDIMETKKMVQALWDAQNTKPLRPLVPLPNLTPDASQDDVLKKMQAQINKMNQ